MALSTAEIKKMLENAGIEDVPMLCKGFETDERKSVAKLCASFMKKYNNHISELKRLEEMAYFETMLYNEGYSLIGGIDEVGRGPLAGPVAAACVVLKRDSRIVGINDSKKLSAARREELCAIIKDEAVSWGVGIVSPAVIDDINILQATYEAMRTAVKNMGIHPEYVLADAVTIPSLGIPQKGIIKGDAKSMSIAAASIVAKVERDAIMDEYAKIYPEYGFDSNKGYGSSEHIEAIKKYGLTPIHRLSFVKNIVEV
ncbi:MAG: ribonuclease HII [Lachnospiraceae bacterium]|nr:ribonuclease HII [Lachnospiraceae bacterium]